MGSDPINTHAYLHARLFNSREADYMNVRYIPLLFENFRYHNSDQGSRRRCNPRHEKGGE